MFEPIQKNFYICIAFESVQISYPKGCPEVQSM